MAAMSAAPRPTRAAAAAALRQVLAMLRPPNMAAARCFMLRHDAETDLGVLSDVGAVRNASLLSGESVVLNTPSGTALDTLLVPFVNLGQYTVGVVVVSTAPFACLPLAGVDDSGAELSLGAPMAGKCLGPRRFSAGRFIRAGATGEILYVLSDLRGGRVETVSLVWVGPGFGPERRARETVALSCDAAPFAAGRLVDSVATYSHTVRWQRGAAPALMRLPDHALDFAANATNMAEYAGSTDVYVVQDMALVGPDGRLVSERRSSDDGDPRGRGRRLLTSFVDSLAHWPTHVLRASLMQVAVQTRVGLQSPLRWGVSPIVDTYSMALEHAVERVSALRIGSTTDEDELFEHTEQALLLLDEGGFEVESRNASRFSGNDTASVNDSRSDWVSNTIRHRLGGLVKDSPSVVDPAQVLDVRDATSWKQVHADSSLPPGRVGDGGGLSDYGSGGGGSGGGASRGGSGGGASRGGSGGGGSSGDRDTGDYEFAEAINGGNGPQRDWNWLDDVIVGDGRRLEERSRPIGSRFADATFLSPAAYIQEPESPGGAPGESSGGNQPENQNRPQSDTDLPEDPVSQLLQQSVARHGFVAGNTFLTPAAFEGERNTEEKPVNSSPLDGVLEEGAPRFRASEALQRDIQPQRPPLPVGQSSFGTSMLNGNVSSADRSLPLTRGGLPAEQILASREPRRVEGDPKGDFVEVEKAAQSIFDAMERGHVSSQQRSRLAAPAEMSDRSFAKSKRHEVVGSGNATEPLANTAAAPRFRVGGIASTSGVGISNVSYPDGVRPRGTRAAGSRDTHSVPVEPSAQAVPETREEAEERKRQKRRADNIAAAKRSNAKRKAEYEALVQALDMAKRYASVLRRKEAGLQEANKILRASVYERSLNRGSM